MRRSNATAASRSLWATISVIKSVLFGAHRELQLDGAIRVQLRPQFEGHGRHPGAEPFCPVYAGMAGGAKRREQAIFVHTRPAVVNDRGACSATQNAATAVATENPFAAPAKKSPRVVLIVITQPADAAFRQFDRPPPACTP